MKKCILLIPLLTICLLSGCDNNNTSSEMPNTLTNALNYSRDHSFSVLGSAYLVYENEDVDNDLSSFDINNVFDKGILSSKLVYHYQLDDGNVFNDEYNATYFAKDDGFTYRRELALNNTVVDNPVYGKSGDKIKFEENFDSPFKSLKYSDFVKMEDSFLLKPQVSTGFTTTLTQQRMSTKKTTFKIEGGKFASIVINTSSSSSIVSGLSMSYRYELDFVWDVKGSIPSITPFKHEKYHEDLEKALFTLNRDLNKKNYTADTVLEVDNNSSNTTFFATSEGIYSDAVDSYNKTYGVKKEGSSYYEFVVSVDKDGQQKITIYDDDPIDGSLLYPQYSSFAPEMFTKVNDEFVANAGTESAIISLIAPYTEANYYANYITSLKIKLNNNKFDHLYLEFYDYQNNISGNATITYKDIGNTELPIIF